MAETNQKSRSGCPCLHTAPCHPHCTCVHRMSSTGCRRCATYGSEQQRAARAEFIAAAISAAELASNAINVERFTKRRGGLHVSEHGFDRSKPPVLHTEYSPGDDVTAIYLQLSSEPANHTDIYRGAVLVDTDAQGKLRGVEFVGGAPLDSR